MVSEEEFEEYSSYSKEAREYIKGWEPDDPDEYDDSEWFIDNYKEDVMQAFDDGRESMSEWHYISKGDLPEDADKDYLFVAITSEGTFTRQIGSLNFFKRINADLWDRTKVHFDKRFYAWTELPEYPEFPSGDEFKRG